MEKLNNDIGESYCSFEVSKMLYEKGCTCQDGLTAYSLDGKSSISHASSFYSYTKFPIDTITHALAIEWIRVNFNWHFELIWDVDYKLYWYVAISKIGDTNPNSESIDCKKCTNPHEANEAALKYCLTELIG